MSAGEVFNLTFGDETQPGYLTIKNGKVSIQLADGTWLIVDGVLQGLEGTKTYYVASSSGGSPTKQLVFKNGLLISET